MNTLTVCKLIVHADDLGISASVNDGVLLAHQRGILTSASLMAGGAAFDAAVAMLRGAPRLDIGVHLTLVGEKPLLAPAQIPSLVDAAGRLHGSAAEFMRRYLRGSISIDEVRLELDAQVARVKANVASVTHLDSHQHLHMVPAIHRVAVELAAKYSIAGIRHPREALRPYMLGSLTAVPRLLQMLVLNGFCAASGNAGARYPDHFVGFYHGGRMTKKNLLTVLRSLPAEGVCELMCHPGNASQDEVDREWGYRWREERDALMDSDVRACIDRRRIRLISYADLARS